MTEAEFKLFRDLIYSESGMCLRSGKKEFLGTLQSDTLNETLQSSPWINQTQFCRRHPHTNVLSSNAQVAANR